MIAYHGTTRMRARGIFKEGFVPKPPSRRVWFAESRGYALGRAKTQARRATDEPVVLTCDLDLDKLRHDCGSKSVVYRKGIIAINGRVPATVMLSYPFADLATVPDEVADWVNHVLGLAPEDAVQPDRPGLIRLSRWINARLVAEPDEKLLLSELMEKAKRWLPEFFFGVELDSEQLRAHRRVGLTDYEVDARAFEPDPRELEALDCLEAPGARRRARGLSLLAEIRDPDLFDWCTMFLDDEAVTVRVAALQTMLECKDVLPEVVGPFAGAEDRRVRAAAIAALSKHGGDEATDWIKRGLKDPSACVRVAAARFLGKLDARDHRSVFEIALHDPNPDVARRARKTLSEKQRAKTKRRRRP